MDATDRPTLRGLWIAIGMLVTSLLVAAVWLTWALVTVDARVADFPRAQVPGGMRVEVEEPGADLVVYEEGSPSRPVRYDVLGPGGEVVDVERYGRGGSFTYTYKGDEGRAVHTFAAELAGTYIVSADTYPSFDSAGATFAVAPSIGRRLVLGIVGPMVLGAAGITVAIVLGVVSFVRYAGAASPATEASS